MDAERFEALAQAYGADLRRWPADAREPARALLAVAPGLQAVLAEADALDAALDGWRVAAPSAALREKVLAGAPKPRRRRLGLGLWLSGAGFAAAAAAAGVVAGVALIDAATYDDRADGLLSAAYNVDNAGLTAFTVGAVAGHRA